jgi:catechol 2,3-dioxygenase-like lactoylglutathione lyase family enzyme
VATIDHVTIRVSDLGAACTLYDRCFDLLAFDGERADGAHFREWNDFSLSDRGPTTTGLHVGFAARSREQVDAWWHGMTAAGSPADGAPGPRPEYGSDYYGGFVRDLDGNSIEAVHHGTANPDTGVIDHLWVRVHDLEAARQLYTAVAPVVGVHVNDHGDRIQLVTTSGTCSFLAGPPTANLHLAFGVDDNAAVDAFHAAGLAAGAPDNGAPGERAVYHAGYYGAFLIDPGGNNIEAVCHNR